MDESGAILLVLVGLTAVRQAVRRNTADLKILKFSTDRIGRIFVAFDEGTVLL